MKKPKLQAITLAGDHNNPVQVRADLSTGSNSLPSDKFSSLPEPAILGLVEGMSIQQVDLALRLLDEAAPLRTCMLWCR
jgi:hypothetical protein